jgi:hypothetical protein
MSRSRAKVLLIATITVTSVVFAVYALLPWSIDRLVRSELLKLPQFHVSYSRVKVSLLRGSYALEDIRVCRRSSPQLPFFQAESIEFGISPYLFESGTLTGRITAHAARLDFVDTDINEEMQRQMRYAWKNIPGKLIVLPLDEIRIVDGKITYAELISTPHISLEMDDINISVRDIDCPIDPDADNELVAHAEGDARINNGKLNFSIDFNPSAKQPVFQLKARLENFDLSYLSDYLKVHGNYTIEEGLFSMVTQASGDEANVSGFVKPLLETIQFASSSAQSDAVFRRNRFARLYPQMSFRNDFDSVTPSLWTAVVFTMRSAFFEALIPVIQTTESMEQDLRRRPITRPALPKVLRQS